MSHPSLEFLDTALFLPDGHEGYGFPVGGVAAMDAEEGMISPGGVGYDINCGVRLLRSNLDRRYCSLKTKRSWLLIFLVPFPLELVLKVQSN